MTGRRSITEEARRRRQPDEDDSNTNGDRESSDNESTERRKFTQRMPEGLVEDIDEFADRHGMSRNAAINLLAKTGLDDF